MIASFVSLCDTFLENILILKEKVELVSFKENIT